MTITELFDTELPDEDEAFTRAKRTLIEAHTELDECALWRRQGAISVSRMHDRLDILTDDIIAALGVLRRSLDEGDDDDPDSGSTARIAC